MTVFTETWGNKALENIATEDQKLEIQAYADKLAIIREVLARRHMKVAFFGRYLHLHIWNILSTVCLERMLLQCDNNIDF